MRSIETLVRAYPEKTGSEILFIQEQDKLVDQQEFEKQNKDMLDLINDVNTNGGYYRGKFGLDQYYYYRIFDLNLESHGEVRMGVESIVVFHNSTNETHHVTKPNEIKIERRIDDYRSFDQYGIDDCERITVKEWDLFNDYLNNITELFWDKKV